MQENSVRGTTSAAATARVEHAERERFVEHARIDLKVGGGELQHLWIRHIRSTFAVVVERHIAQVQDSSHNAYVERN